MAPGNFIQPQGSHLRYRPDIDGLRALAVVPVVLFHANLFCPGGFVGVDIFFVISGYLITSLLFKDFEKNQFSLIDFWTRRLRRIFPALCCVILTTLVIGWFFFLPDDYVKLGQSACAQPFLAANFYFWRQGDYFQSSNLFPLLHTWSLAVEEQFYLFFPLLLLSIRGLGKPRQIGVLSLLGVLSFGACIYCSYFHATFNFYALPTRAWELLIGALAAMLSPQHKLPKIVAELLSLIGIVAILFAVFAYNRETRFPGFAALAPCLGAFLIIYSNGAHLTRVGKVLSWKPVVFIGLISYSLYLWHWPLFAFTRYYLPDADSTLGIGWVGLVVASGVLAVLSWRFVEVPFRRQTLLPGEIRIWSGAGVMVAVILLAGFAITQMKGIPSRLPERVLVYAATQPNATDLNISLQQAQTGDFAELGARDKKLPVSLFVWGDSHAMAIKPILDLMCREYGIRGLMASHFATPSLLGFNDPSPWSLKEQTILFGNAIVEYIRKNHIRHVLLVCRWGGDYGKSPRELHEKLMNTVTTLESLGCDIRIMQQIPRPGIDVPKTLAMTALFQMNPPSPSISLRDTLDDRRFQAALFQGISSPTVTFLDPSGLFIDAQDRFIVEDHGLPLYMDDNHITTTGAMRLRPLFEPMFKSISTPK